MKASIEGNIGCGKSTLIKYMKENTNLLVLEEAAELWGNFKGTNVIEEFYKDKQKYAYLFQNLIMHTMKKQYLLHPDILERSLFTARYCFAELLRQSNYISKLEHDMLDLHYTEIMKEVEEQELIVYIRSKPRDVITNIKKRDRQGEDRISVEYLQQLHEFHESWLIDRNFGENRPIIVVNRLKYQDKVSDMFSKLQPYLDNNINLLPYQTVWL